MGMSGVVAKHICIPLLAMMYLAPLKDLMDRKGCGPAFSLFLVGASGDGKSTAAALALSHFGEFDYLHMPASFKDTAYSVLRKAFLVKDMPLLVDDYHPASSIQERKKMEATAQSLSRAFGDGSTRGRLNADISIREDNPPRCVSVITGEQSPDIGESGLSRFYAVKVEENDVTLDGDMTLLQEMAQHGYLQKAMRGYIEWLLPQMEDLPNELAERFHELRSRAQRNVPKGTHARVPPAIASLVIGYEMFLRFLLASCVIGADEAETERKEAWRVILENSRSQAKEAKEERPGIMFVNVIGELLTAKTAEVKDLTDKSSTTPGLGMVGWMDERFYYLLPDIAYKMVANHVRQKGHEMALSERSLYRQMHRDGLVTPPNQSKVYTFPRRVSAKETRRVLWIPCRFIDGGDPVQEQIKMDFDGVAAVVDDKEIPF